MLQRLEGFLEVGKCGQNGRRSTADRDEQETEKKEEPVPKKERTGQGVKTYAEAARKGTSKEQEQTETQPKRTTPTMSL